MKIKVCGLKHIDNIKDMHNLSIDFIGLNFYSKSKRYIEHDRAFEIHSYKKHKKVGVFVNAKLNYLLDMVKIFKLDYVQLHGHENPDYTKMISKDVKVIKVFSIKNKEDFEVTKEYSHCKFFLFDTATPEFGGSGKKFDWQILQEYKGTTPFFLAGGIGPNDVQTIKELNHPSLAGIDINSKFEITPGLKNIKIIQEFIQKLRSYDK